MPIVKPFKGVRYNKAKLKNLSAVVAPPYDIIPPEMQNRLYRASPYNIVRLELNKIGKLDDEKNNRYTRAGEAFESWQRSGVLVRDAEESIYIYSQEYKYNKKPIRRIGFISLMGLETDSSSSKVLPHENTLAAPKADRLKLMKEVRANLSPIFILYEDNARRITSILKKFIARNRPVIDVYFDQARHKVWKLSDTAAIDKIRKIMREKDTFIADGHHRYETARNYSRMVDYSDATEDVKKAARYLMVYFVESDEKMLTILPAHRAVKDTGTLSGDEAVRRLSRFFTVEKAPSLRAMMKRLGRLGKVHAFGTYAGEGKYYILKLKDAGVSDEAIRDKSKDWKRLDVSILHLFIFQHVLGISDDDDNIEFLKNPEDAADLVDKGRCKIAFFLNPTKVSEVKKIARLGERMPRKATYFYPKPVSGLVINKLEG
ncbi:MAG: DUF1015 domain-containing protein [Candidatus Omnitrophota bacterium]|nr:DUF1015 domain-containing protein [Candidatus Omnitrophota bacterium]